MLDLFFRMSDCLFARGYVTPTLGNAVWQILAYIKAFKNNLMVGVSRSCGKLLTLRVATLDQIYGTLLRKCIFVQLNVSLVMLCATAQL